MIHRVLHVFGVLLASGLFAGTAGAVTYDWEEGKGGMGAPSVTEYAMHQSAPVLYASGKTLRGGHPFKARWRIDATLHYEGPTVRDKSGSGDGGGPPGRAFKAGLTVHYVNLVDIDYDPPGLGPKSDLPKKSPLAEKLLPKVVAQYQEANQRKQPPMRPGGEKGVVVYRPYSEYPGIDKLTKSKGVDVSYTLTEVDEKDTYFWRGYVTQMQFAY